ncbi:MAG: DUF4118 domain-containing protein, partial [Chloroflexi bacterium]|nr:DUF4118 domain-containing protein [Chloroflexota bacterium]
MTGKFVVNYRSLAAAALIPFIAAGVQWLLWRPYFQPFIWFLFYPATFLSAWLSGRWGGVLSTLLSAALAVYIFAPPMFSFQLDNPATLFSAAVFIIMGFLFSYVFDAWKQANRRVDVLEQLHASEARYAELVQHANTAILRWRVDGTIVYCNEYAQTLFGYRADKISGQPVGVLVPPQESTGGDLSALVQDIVAHPERFES